MEFLSWSWLGHRHVPEIEQGLSEAANSEVTVSFTPHLMPMSRGMQSTIYVELAPGVSVEDLYQHLRIFYEKQNGESQAIVVSNPSATNQKLDLDTSLLVPFKSDLDSSFITLEKYKEQLMVISEYVSRIEVGLLRGQKSDKVDVTLQPEELEVMNNVLHAKYEEARRRRSCVVSGRISVT